MNDKFGRNANAVAMQSIGYRIPATWLTCVPKVTSSYRQDTEGLNRLSRSLCFQRLLKHPVQRIPYPHKELSIILGKYKDSRDVSVSLLPLPILG